MRSLSHGPRGQASERQVQGGSRGSRPRASAPRGEPSSKHMVPQKETTQTLPFLETWVGSALSGDGDPAGPAGSQESPSCVLVLGTLAGGSRRPGQEGQHRREPPGGQTPGHRAGAAGGPSPTPWPLSDCGVSPVGAGGNWFRSWLCGCQLRRAEHPCTEAAWPWEQGCL